MLFAWKSRARCIEMLGDEWKRRCFRQTTGRWMRWKGWENSQKHKPENTQRQQSSEAKWCKMHHLMLTIYLKGIWKTRKILRFDGLKALKNARIARSDEWICKQIPTNLACRWNVFGKPQEHVLQISASAFFPPNDTFGVVCFYNSRFPKPFLLTKTW